MRKEYKDAQIDITPTFSAPGMETPEDLAITQLVRELTGEKNILNVAYATEGGLFQQAGIPTVICGPGSIEHAHRANEFVSIEQISKCEEFLLKIAKRFCSNHS